MVFPHLALLLYLGMDKALQHAPGIVAALIGIRIAARAQCLELQPGGLPRDGHALQALPLVQQLMGKDACDLRMRQAHPQIADRKSTRLNSSHSQISYAVFCLKKKISERMTTYTFV